MKTITIITPSNIEVEYLLAGVGSRVAAFIIDVALQLLLITAFALIVLLGIDRGIYGNRLTPSGTALGAVILFNFVVQFGYFIIYELAMRGQSVGKRLFSLRVIRDNGQPIGFAQSLVRGLLRSLDIVYIGLFTILFSKKHKRLGDMAAGTIVIIERRNETFEKSLYSTAPYWPNFLPDPFLLSPEERQLTEEWLNRRDYMLDGGAAVGERLMKYFEKYKNTEEGIS